jgi:hypothetical protein
LASVSVDGSAEEAEAQVTGSNGEIWRIYGFSVWGGAGGGRGGGVAGYFNVRAV